MATQNGLTQQELESRLWAAANSLRGPVDPADFNAYIFSLLFFRRVSDTWDDEQPIPGPHPHVTRVGWMGSSAIR